MIQIQTLVHLCKVVKLQDMVLLLGTKSMKRYQKKKGKQQLILCISLARSGKPNYKTQAMCIPSLGQYIAAGFDRNSYVALVLDKWHDNGGIHMLKNDDISHIKSSMKQQILNLLKFHACLAYLLELGYDVAILELGYDVAIQS